MAEEPLSEATEAVLPIVLSDGGTAELRSIGPGDREALRALHGELSSESRYFRYFSWRRGIGEPDLERFTRPDGRLHAGLVALVSGEVVGHACFDRTEGARAAEVAFEIADAHQHRGLGTLLVEALAERARRAGIERFTARVLPDNWPCLRLLHDLGFAEQTRFEDGTIVVSLDLVPSEAYRAAVEARRASAREARTGHGFCDPERDE